MSRRKARVWAGVDAGRGHHWAAVVDETGATLFSKKVDNDEPAVDLALLTAHRSDLVADRGRLVNRPRHVLTGIFPALERAFDYSSQRAALVLLTGYQTPGRDPPPGPGPTHGLVG